MEIVEVSTINCYGCGALVDDIEGKPKFEWIEAPVPNGTKTIINVLAANGKEEHEMKVREWVENVWDFWYKKHGKTMKIPRGKPRGIFVG